MFIVTGLGKLLLFPNLCLFSGLIIKYIDSVDFAILFFFLGLKSVVAISFQAR